MTFVRRTTIARRNASLDPLRVAFVRGEPLPENTPPMQRFLIRFELWTGHRHARLGYGVHEVAEALGVDLESLYAREHMRPRGEWHRLQSIGGGSR
jgi:hypothetical protein